MAIPHDRPVIGTDWQHVKTGGKYAVVGECVIEATMKVAFLYKSHKTGIVWARPKDEFLDGRFAYIGPTPQEQS